MKYTVLALSILALFGNSAKADWVVSLDLRSLTCSGEAIKAGPNGTYIEVEPQENITIQSSGSFENGKYERNTTYTINGKSEPLTGEGYSTLGTMQDVTYMDGIEQNGKGVLSIVEISDKLDEDTYWTGALGTLDYPVFQDLVDNGHPEKQRKIVAHASLFDQQFLVACGVTLFNYCDAGSSGFFQPWCDKILGKH